MLMNLYYNEIEYTKSLYDPLGLTEEVVTFLEYNANKALANLGFPELFPTSASDVNPMIINGLAGTSTSHDFFSKVGNSYFVGSVEAISDEEYDEDFLNQAVALDVDSEYIEVVDKDGVTKLVKNKNFDK